VRRTVGFVAHAPDGEIGTSLQKPRSVNTILPVDREWIIALSIDDGMLAAFDSQTLDPLFEGRYFAPKKYGRRDPRRWPLRTFEKLKGSAPGLVDISNVGGRPQEGCRNAEAFPAGVQA
jgi:hypothetical protein